MSDVPAVPTPQPLTTAVEDALMKGNLAGLTAEDRVQLYNATCHSLGLNPLTVPFQYITLNGQLKLYATRNCADQLRKLHDIDLIIVDRQTMGDLYVVTVRAKLPNGRADEEIGAVSIAGMRGEALANAMMKATTKAKRRVTLSIVGLSLLDESEIEGVPGAVVYQEPELTRRPLSEAKAEATPEEIAQAEAFAKKWEAAAVPQPVAKDIRGPLSHSMRSPESATETSNPVTPPPPPVVYEDHWETPAGHLPPGDIADTAAGTKVAASPVSPAASSMPGPTIAPGARRTKAASVPREALMQQLRHEYTRLKDDYTDAELMALGFGAAIDTWDKVDRLSNSSMKHAIGRWQAIRVGPPVDTPSTEPDVPDFPPPRPDGDRPEGQEQAANGRTQGNDTESIEDHETTNPGGAINAESTPTTPVNSSDPLPTYPPPEIVQPGANQRHVDSPEDHLGDPPETPEVMVMGPRKGFVVDSAVRALRQKAERNGLLEYVKGELLRYYIENDNTGLHLDQYQDLYRSMPWVRA